MGRRARVLSGKVDLEVAGDGPLGDYRWLLTRLPDNRQFSVNLDVAKTDEQRALVGRRAAHAPLSSIETNDCRREDVVDELSYLLYLLPRLGKHVLAIVPQARPSRLRSPDGVEA